MQRDPSFQGFAVLINLASNAVRYAQGGVIKIASDKGEQGTIIRISDTGRGIPADDLCLTVNKNPGDIYRVSRVFINSNMLQLSHSH